MEPPTANSRPSDHASTEDDFFARSPLGGHWFGGTEFPRLYFGYAAGPIIVDAVCIVLERPVLRVNPTLSRIKYATDGQAGLGHVPLGDSRLASCIRDR